MVAALATVALLAVPPVYLLVRAGTGDAWEVLAHASTRETLWRTVTLVAGVAACAVVVGGSMAWLVSRTDVPLARLWGVAAVVPLAMPSFVAALALAGSTGASGLISQVLGGLGLGPVPRMEGYTGALLANTMATFPYVYLVTSAALRSVDPGPEEAARSLGRGPVAAFMAASFPSLRRALTGAGLLAGLYALSDFGAVSLMRYTTVTRAIFSRYESGSGRASAAVLGLLLIVLTAALLWVEHRARGRDVRAARAGVRRAAPRLGLGRWRWVAAGWAALVTAGLVVLPLAVMTYWIARAVGNGTLGAIPWAATLTSLALAAVAAVVATFAALPVTLLARRYPRGWTRALAQAGYGANALPGVVVGLALVFLGARYMPWLYQTFPLLIAAYVIRFLAEALVGTDTALAAVNRHTEEAARSLGHGRLSTFARVTLPVMRPGLVASGMLVFLSVIKELPATALLLPTGARTLSTEVWRKTSVGAYGAAAVPALMLVIVSLPFIVVAMREHVGDHRDAVSTAGSS